MGTIMENSEENLIGTVRKSLAPSLWHGAQVFAAVPLEDNSGDAFRLIDHLRPDTALLTARAAASERYFRQWLDFPHFDHISPMSFE
jgi:hypothetical protein